MDVRTAMCAHYDLSDWGFLYTCFLSCIVCIVYIHYSRHWLKI